ncbi:MAG: family 10 glycosylhydrolase [Oscillospiraceae bacterium]|nr:family 10 glycosylhydrolase [Candidatus Ruminococcus equi]
MYIKKVLPILLSVIILVFSVVVVSNSTQTKTVQANTSTIDQTNEDEPMRGVWVSYITLDMENTDKSKETFESKIDDIIENIKSSGFNTMIAQVRPFCDALYKSSYFPYSHILSGTQGESAGYDALKIMSEKCRENKLSLHIWINPYRVRINESPRSLSDDNPYVTDKSIGFEINGNIYLNPASKKVQKLIVDGVTEIVKNYDIDGIQFDDYFYPENCGDFDEEEYHNSNTELSLSEWRKDNVSSMIKKCYNSIKEINKNVVFGISPQGNINNNEGLYADVYKWCEEDGYIDYICPQIYFSLDNPALTFEESLKMWAQINKHKNLKVYVGLAGYKAQSDADSGTWLDNTDILESETKIADKYTDGIMLYSYESLISSQGEEEIQNVVRYLTTPTQ